MRFLSFDEVSIPETIMLVICLCRNFSNSAIYNCQIMTQGLSMRGVYFYKGGCDGELFGWKINKVRIRTFTYRKADKFGGENSTNDVR
jgi:hypothetical protein